MDSQLVRKIKKACDYMDRQIGKRAVYREETHGAPDLETGATPVQKQDTQVVIRPNPLSMNELASLSRAGITNIATRWNMQTKYKSDVAVGDVLIVGGFEYEIVGEPAIQTDELNVESTFFVRRRQ